ncbi:aldo/keto reductase [Alcaligenes ammonioxydans]|jgi:diketogulonate reductase-like aldo/keto reductase|uniref:aldo/keto reductase n=1 Tax=Alcaligenes TaxID=507 RepID=UPI000269E983|nr:aldo/keto reductase [Alcaligenes ammonioxydans]EJC65487.1 aldo/keto reductase [Alcaligenes faecalis subsp. faecalis NCIB 8687]MCH1878335.1 aldo/keto reductase [Alcaligenes ammonioxydans]HRK85368.1 aldo/keto reductase [Alcaligenes faecalis]
MRYAPLGSASRVSRVGQGSWYVEQSDRAQSIAAFRAGLDAGMNHIDTAEMYGDGQAESLIGQALQGRRHEAFLVSKVLPFNASRQGVIRACEASLKRLGTDYLDLYLLHWPGQIPLEETCAAFDKLVQQGKIKQWGVSNFDVPELEALYDIVGPGEIACNQVLYHLNERAIEHAVMPWCQEHQVSVVAYSPFGHDDFPEPDSEGGALLAEIATQYQATARQVALAFLLRDPHVFVIPKASRAAHAQQNAAAGDLILQPEHIQALDAQFPRGPKPPYLPMI